MTLEALSAIAQVGTFVVIAATAIAALIQLRHLRAANDITTSNTFMQEFEGRDLREAFTFVRTQLAAKLKDPAFRQELRGGRTDRTKHPEMAICNLFDQWGGYYRHGAINRTQFMRHNAGVVASMWKTLEPVVALTAQASGGVNASFEQFEYVAVQAQDWLEKHPGGDYPSGVRRIPLTDPWAKEDSGKISGSETSR